MGDFLTILDLWRICWVTDETRRWAHERQVGALKKDMAIGGEAGGRVRAGCCCSTCLAGSGTLVERLKGLAAAEAQARQTRQVRIADAPLLAS